MIMRVIVWFYVCIYKINLFYYSKMFIYDIEIGDLKMFNYKCTLLWKY
jgi:hypothetical protein